MIKLSIQAWMLIKEYCGIYHIPIMDYKLLRNMSVQHNNYILETYKKLCKHVPSNSSVMYKSLGQGYKCKEFYTCISSALMKPLPWKCVCNIIETTSQGVIDHVRKVDHIIAIKSRKYDVMIIQKFKKDPYLFKYLHYCGFTSNTRGDDVILHTTFNCKFINPVLNYNIVLKQN